MLGRTNTSMRIGVRPPISERNINVELSLDETDIFSNPKLLQQVWINLLSNAVKFTPDNGTITVCCFNQDGKVAVSVKDNGCGMSAEVMTNIFNKFYQGDKSHTTPGNGLGLSIVKKIVEILNGSITVASEIGKGSSFIITLDAVSEEK